MPGCRRWGNVFLSPPTFNYRRDTLMLDVNLVELADAGVRVVRGCHGPPAAEALRRAEPRTLTEITLPCAKRAKTVERAAPGCSWQLYIEHCPNRQGDHPGDGPPRARQRALGLHHELARLRLDRRACRSRHLLTVGRTPAAAPSAARSRVHSRTSGGVGYRLADGEPIDRSPSHEGSTIRRRGSDAAHDAGAHRPAVPERLRAGASREAGAAYFFRKIRGCSVSSSVLMAPITQRFVDAIKQLRRTQGIDVVSFRRGERKDDRTQEYLRQWTGGRGCPLHRQGTGEGRPGCSAPSAATTRPPGSPMRGWWTRRRWSTTTTSVGRRFRSVLPEVLFVLPLQREAVHQRGTST